MEVTVDIDTQEANRIFEALDNYRVSLKADHNPDRNKVPSRSPDDYMALIDKMRVSLDSVYEKFQNATNKAGV